MKHVKHWLIVMSIVGGATAGPARAAPYWVAWEGNDFPENEGWTRWHHDSDWAASRSLANGIMTLDGLTSIEITDAYRMERSLNPAPGEEFVLQCGIRVSEIGNPNFPYDPGWTLTSDDGWHVAIVIGVDEVQSILEQHEVGFEPAGFQTWEFRSRDMRSYTLRLNGSLIHTGAFVQTGVLESRISWGDLVYGANSYSDWDYFRFGVVPEPGSSASLLVLLCAARAIRTA